MLLTTDIAKAYVEYQKTWEGEVSDISDYTHLDVGVAAVLAELDESLDLSVRELSEDDAKALLSHKEGLNLRGDLLKISDEVAQILAGYEGSLNLEKVLVGEAGREALISRENYKNEEEWHSYVTVIDQSWLDTFDPDEYDHDPMGTSYLESSSAAKKLVDLALEELKGEDGGYFMHSLGSFNYYSVEALREIARYDGELRFNWGDKRDTSGDRWSDEHFEALGLCAGPISLFCGGLGEQREEAISKRKLEAFREQDLTLEFLRYIPDDCYEAIKGRSGSLLMEGLTDFSAKIGEALSTVRELRLGDVSSIECLEALCGAHSEIDHLTLGTQYIDGAIATILSSFNGYLNLDGVIYFTEEAGEILGQKVGGLYIGGGESILVEGNGLAGLLKHEESNWWPEQDVYDEEGEWIRSVSWGESVNGVIEASEVVIEGDDDYQDVTLPVKPMITNEALGKAVSVKNCSLSDIRLLTEGQSEIIGNARGSIQLGVCRLTDQQVSTLLNIRGTIGFDYLKDLSEQSAQKLFRSQKVSYLPEHLQKGKEAFEEGGDDEEEEVNSETNQVVEDVYFNYGRLKARLTSGSTTLGGPMDLLDEIEETIRGGDFPIKHAQVEFLLGQFFLACANGDDTSEIKNEIDELFWNS